jgi:hypothetical protein
MDEQKLVKLLKEHFPTKEEFGSFKTEMHEFKAEMYEVGKETRSEFRLIREDLKEIKEKLDDVKSSANALDGILEQNPIPRIERLEKHIGLEEFVPVLQD